MPLRQLSGHTPLRRILARAVVRRSVPPSLLFSGPRGVGKCSIALALAQLANCLDVTDDDACGECTACRRIARGLHPDVLVLEPGDTGTIKIESVRDAIERVAFRPFEGRTRFVIVDEADALVWDAQSALLKTLEEPPSTSVFVLVSARPDALLPTVRSRCPQFRFGPLTADEVANVLIATHGYSETDARSVAATAGGSLGRALEAASDAFRDARQAAHQFLEVAARGAGPRPLLAGAAEFAKIPKAASGGPREMMALRLRAMASLVRDLEVVAIGADDGRVVNRDLLEGLRPMTRSLDRQRLLDTFAAVMRSLGAIERNASPKIVADWLAFQI